MEFTSFIDFKEYVSTHCESVREGTIVKIEEITYEVIELLLSKNNYELGLLPIKVKHNYFFLYYGK